MKFIKNPITYKILVDIFFISLVIAIIFITSEALLPGILSAYISPMLLFTALFIIVIVISFIAHTQRIHIDITKPKKYLQILFILLFTVLLTVSSLGYDYLSGSIIVVLSIITYLSLNSLLQHILQND